MLKGKVKFFNETKGFGFIVQEDSGEEIFVHVSETKGPLNKDDTVSFEVKEGRRGPQAANVEVVPA